MSKLKIIDKKSEKSIKYERELLSHLKHPFIINMYYAFQDNNNLYLVMDYLSGGDLRYQICKTRKFTEQQTKFFLCNIILGLEYIHNKRVIHRDIKPENLILDKNGYIRITDFGISKIFSNSNYKETSGTPGYMSPEVIQCQNHTKAVDYFALGIIGYELMYGKRPYLGKSRIEIKEKMMIKEIVIKNNDFPFNWSKESKDFISKLLIRKPEKRLGFGNVFDVKNHSWVKFFPWDKLFNKELIAPFIPSNGDNFDSKYCNAIEKIGLNTQKRYEYYIKGYDLNSFFVNFTYYPLLDNDEEKYMREKDIRKFSLNVNGSNDSKIKEKSNSGIKKRCQSAIGEKKSNYNSNKGTLKKKIDKLNIDNNENNNSSNNKEIEMFKKKHQIFKKTKSYNKNTCNNNNQTMKNFSSIKKNLLNQMNKEKMNSSNIATLEKNNNLNLKSPNEQKSATNLFLNYQTLSKTNNIIKKAIKNLRQNSASSKPIKHLENMSFQNIKNKSINERSNSYNNNASIKKIIVNTNNYSGKFIKSKNKIKEKNSNSIIGLEIKKISKNKSRTNNSKNSSKKNLGNSNSITIFKSDKVSSTSYNSTGSNSSFMNNCNLKNKTTFH